MPNTSQARADYYAAMEAHVRLQTIWPLEHGQFATDNPENQKAVDTHRAALKAAKSLRDNLRERVFA